MLTKLFTLPIMFRIITACGPPFSIDSMSSFPMVGVSGTDSAHLPKARGQSILKGNTLGANTMTLGLGSSTSPPIRSSADLSCSEFDTSCRWRNMEGLFIDELDWFQGSGMLDPGRLHIATGTNIFPDGMYGIVATDSVQLATAKAVLVSDPIECQRGQGHIRMLYWTSPEVRLKVCTKETARPYPSFSSCSETIDAGDPGPATVTIPEQSNGPFQIFIIADNFVFQAVNLQGGFAIIDDIEYEANLCTNYIQERVQPSGFLSKSSEQLSSMVEPPAAATLFPTLAVRKLNQVEEAPPTRKPFMFMSSSLTRHHSKEESAPAVVFNSEDTLHPLNNNEVVAACEALVCSFNQSQPCIQFAESSSWQVSNRPVGNPLTGIRGDATDLPFNRGTVSSSTYSNPSALEGSFAFVAGPTAFSKFSTPPFYLDRNSLFVFSYHKVDRTSSFRVLLKKATSQQEEMLFEAPIVSRDSRRWFREGKKIDSGQYDYLSFQVESLPANGYIGVDEWSLVDESRMNYCH